MRLPTTYHYSISKVADMPTSTRDWRKVDAQEGAVEQKEGTEYFYRVQEGNRPECCGITSLRNYCIAMISSIVITAHDEHDPHDHPHL